MVDVESRAARDGNPHSRRRAVILALSGHRITYLFAGAMTAAVHYVLLGLGLLVAEGAVHYLFLVVASHFFTVVIVYPWYRLVVFRARGESWLTGCLRFYAVGAGFLATSVIAIPIFVELIGVPVMVAQAMVVLMSPPLSYAIHRKWTFRDRGSM